MMADPRVVTGFRPAIKELVYPIVIKRSAGARLWDLDGNEYIDCLNGFGCNLFGWQPEFVTKAIEEQLRGGHEIGPQTPLAGECANLVCEFTGFDRAAFCNTGTEAVMTAVRIALAPSPAATKIAIFAGSYHGIFDEVIVRGTKKGKTIPAAPGIMPSTSENVMVLDYGTPETMAILRANASELAAVLVEPVQSRRPDFQPREFLQELRTLTQESGTVLIFDEVITGFRTCPGGAQAYFGIKADLASYGKVIGGGLPVGVIAAASASSAGSRPRRRALGVRRRLRPHRGCDLLRRDVRSPPAGPRRGEVGAPSFEGKRPCSPARDERQGGAGGDRAQRLLQAVRGAARDWLLRFAVEDLLYGGDVNPSKRSALRHSCA